MRPCPAPRTDTPTSGELQRGGLVLGGYSRIADFHGFILRQIFETCKPLILQSCDSVSKLTVCETGSRAREPYHSPGAGAIPSKFIRGRHTVGVAFSGLGLLFANASDIAPPWLRGLGLACDPNVCNRDVNAFGSRPKLTPPALDTFSDGGEEPVPGCPPA
jgi:hypothetical protein